jgi:hypothetical protein
MKPYSLAGWRGTRSAPRPIQELWDAIKLAAHILKKRFLQHVSSVDRMSSSSDEARLSKLGGNPLSDEKMETHSAHQQLIHVISLSPSSVRR